MMRYKREWPGPIQPPELSAIPAELASEAQWVNWRAAKPQGTSRFSKVPVLSSTGRPLNPLLPENWVSFGAAAIAVSQGDADGIGFVLSGQPIESDANGAHLYLVGIDIDGKSGVIECQGEAIWKTLNRTYVEVSPSGTGLRMFALCRVPVRAGNKNGLEMYSSGRFLTVTGWSARGRLREATNGVLALHKNWFPEQYQARSTGTRKRFKLTPAETPANKAWVASMLQAINADCDYATYRNVIWAIEDLDWACGEDLQRWWSRTAVHRFSEDTLQNLKKSFDPLRGIHFGSVAYYARVAGYRRSRAVS